MRKGDRPMRTKVKIMKVKEIKDSDRGDWLIS